MHTPHSLIGAIENGCDQGRTSRDQRIEEFDIKSHIKDYLAQQFTIAIGRNPDQSQMLIELFNRITK